MSLASGPDGCLDAATGQKPHPTKTIHPSPTSRPWGRAGQGAGTRPPPIVQHLGSRPGFLSKHRGAAKGGGAMHPCHGTQHWGACGDHSGGGEGPRRLRTQDRCTFRPIPHPTSCFKIPERLSTGALCEEHCHQEPPEGLSLSPTRTHHGAALRACPPRGTGTGPGLFCWDPHVKLGRRQRQLAGLIQEQRPWGGMETEPRGMWVTAGPGKAAGPRAVGNNLKQLTRTVSRSRTELPSGAQTHPPSLQNTN